MAHLIPFCSFGGYRRWSRSWWADLAWWLTRGWWSDLSTYWLRARHGWAPRDTWGLDTYLEGVLGGALAHLADTSVGTPVGYPYRECHVKDATTGEVRPYREDDDPNAIFTDGERWIADLRRWATAFADNARDDLYELYGSDKNFDRWHAEEQRRREAVEKALAEMAPWWGALWS